MANLPDLRQQAELEWFLQEEQIRAQLPVESVVRVEPVEPVAPSSLTAAPQQWELLVAWELWLGIIQLT